MALAARLGFLLGANEPLLYTHQYHYFTGGLSIAEHPHPWGFVLGSDEWHLWGGHWTMAPLYHLFIAGVFKLLGPHLTPLQVLQCLLDALTAVMVGGLARRIAGPRGAWAGVAYALYWPAIELPSRTMTENLHTVLLVGAVVALASGTSRVGSSALGGLLLGLSSLARAVSLAFVPLAALWRFRQGGEGRVRAAALVLAASAAAVLPWTARNVFVTDDPLLIESVSLYNLWTDNAFVDSERYDRQEYLIARQPTPASRRAEALWFAWAGVTRRPGMFVEKVWVNFRHFFRPEGLHQLLTAEFPHPAWRHAASLVLDDAVLVLAVPLFILFLWAGRPSPLRSLLGLWTAYYLFMVVVVFHNEIRYRSAFVPFALAGAAAGLQALAEGDPRGRRRAWLALACGLVMVGLMVGPYVGPAWRAARAAWALAPAKAALARGELEAARAAAFAAAQRDWHAVRPWLVFGRWLAWSGHPAEALEAHRRVELRRSGHWVTTVVLPRLLAETGQPEGAAQALAKANDLSMSSDPWLALEIAWRELPPPRADEILLARGDYGAVRGFLHPRGDHRWGRRRAWLRLAPTFEAAAYDVMLEMASPPPSPLTSPVVTVVGPGPASARFRLSPEVRPYTLRVRPVPGEPILVELRAPTWSRAGLPAEQAVRVHRMTVAPVR